MPESSRPTHVRHVVVLVTMFVAVLLYLDRFCLSFAETFIAEDLGLSRTQTGWLLSAFFWSYAIVQVPSGLLTDRLGGRLMLTLYVLAWSLFTGWTGLAIGFVSLFVLRLGVGAGQAGAYPTAASLVSKWVPFAQRGTASSVVALGGRIGGALAPVLTAYLIAGLVPTSVSSEIAPADVLNPAGLLEQLQAAVSQESTSASSADNPAADAKTRKERAAAEVGRRLVSRFSEEGREALLNGSPAAPSQIAKQLAAELNRAIHAENFYDAKTFEEFALPDEAKRYRKTSEAGQSLEPQQLARFNRLLLEAVYPAYVRKVYGAGWRPVMFLFGAAGLLVAALYWWCVRNRPQDHPRCNDAERALIAQGRQDCSPTLQVGPPDSESQATAPDGPARRLPLGQLATNGNLWLANVSMFFTNIGWVFLVSWMPRYFEEVHYIPVEVRGWIGFIPLAAGAVAMLFGGWLTDALVRRIGLRWGRALPMGLSRFLAMAAYLYCLTHPQSVWLIVAALAAVAVFTDLGIGAIWAYCQDVGGRNVASVLGWTNMWGNFGAAVGPVLLGWVASPWIAGPEHQWDATFIICAASFGISGVTALAVDARRPAVADGA
jgi:MFS family permease